jgi:predicted ATPase/DNA-binding winged helix-turn-helix (wHTH) protein
MNVTIPTSRQHSQSSEALQPLRSLSTAPFDAGGQAEDGGPHFSKSVDSVSEISFGPFRLFPKERLLLEADKPIRLGSRALDILITVVERPGQLVSKEELMARVWPNIYVEPANLTVHVAALRRALGDGREGNRYLINIPGRGYRFVAPVSFAEKQTLSSTSLTAPNSAHNLPAQVTRLVGRAETLRVLATQLSHERFLTIVGPGGIGKTSVALALAQEVADTFEHGVWLIDLARVNDASLVPGAIASALGLGTLRGNPINSLVESFRSKYMLLILDNCEHFVDAGASAAVSILRGAPGVRILATSREPLRAEGEHRYRLSSLGVPVTATPLTAGEALRFSAVELFAQCAAARLDDFELTDPDVPFVIDLCRKLDGIPLAIEFAAGHIDTFGVRGLAARLNGGLQQLTGGYRTALPRHQTLRSMLDWSYDWLPETERVILRRISILIGDFTLEQAVAVAGGEDIEACDVADGIASLVTKSLITADISGKEPLYRLLETTRAYALEKLQESDEFDLVARRHAART